MGGVASSTSRNKVVQTSLNTITQQAEANCTANCTQIQSGNTVIIENSTVGDIQFIQQCEVDATCHISNTLDAAAKAIQGSLQNASAQPSWFYPGVQINSAKNNTVQEVRNDLEQKLTSACAATVTQVQTGNLIYAKNSQTGDIGFIQSADLQQSCYLDNSAKAVAATTQKADQFAQAGGIGAGLIAIVLLVVVLIIGIAIVFLFLRNRNRAKKEAASQSYSTGAGGFSSNQLIESERAAAAAGVPTGDYIRAQIAQRQAVPPPSYAPGPFLAPPPPVLYNSPQPGPAYTYGPGQEVQAGGVTPTTTSGGIGSAFVNQAGQITQTILSDKELREATGRALKKGGQQALTQTKKYGGKAVQYSKTALSSETVGTAKSLLTGKGAGTAARTSATKAAASTATKTGQKAITSAGSKAVTKAGAKAVTTSGGKAAAKSTGKSLATILPKVISFIPK